MRIDEVSDQKSLEGFLANNLMVVSKALAFRAALRILPNVQVQETGRFPVEAVVLFRGLIVVSMKLHDYYENIEDAIGSANAAFHDPGLANSYHGFGSAWAGIAAALESVAHDNQPHSWAAIATQNCAGFMSETIWEDVRSDLKILESAHAKEPATPATTIMLKTPLWRAPPGGNWESIWYKIPLKLRRFDSNFSVWTDWFERRVKGEFAAFDIPGDKDRTEDKAILRRLAAATDEDFWGKGYKFVNAELTRWLEEARARAALPTISAEAHGTLELTGSGTIELGPMPLPPQNRNVLSFKATSEGRIAMDASALADQLRADSGARDRFAEAVSEAQLILERCQHSNAGARLARLLENYLAATGTRLAEAKPSLLVQRGERLRQELQTYETPDSFLPPISDDLRNDLIGWRTAHNMMVALDPVLNAADLAMLGPDRQPVLIPRDEIEQQVRQADAAGLIEADEAEIILEGIALAPQTPDLSNRRTLWSVEVIRNLFTESVGIALNPFNADAQLTALNLSWSLKAACGSIDHVKYIVDNREWILSRLGSTPAWQDIITRLADRLEAITPYQSK